MICLLYGCCSYRLIPLDVDRIVYILSYFFPSILLAKRNQSIYRFSIFLRSFKNSNGDRVYGLVYGSPHYLHRKIVSFSLRLIQTNEISKCLNWINLFSESIERGKFENIAAKQIVRITFGKKKNQIEKLPTIKQFLVVIVLYARSAKSC